MDERGDNVYNLNGWNVINWFVWTCNKDAENKKCSELVGRIVILHSMVQPRDHWSYAFVQLRNTWEIREELLSLKVSGWTGKTRHFCCYHHTEGRSQKEQGISYRQVLIWAYVDSYWQSSCLQGCLHVMFSTSRTVVHYWGVLLIPVATCRENTDFSRQVCILAASFAILTSLKSNTDDLLCWYDVLVNVWNFTGMLLDSYKYNIQTVFHSHGIWRFLSLVF